MRKVLAKDLMVGNVLVSNGSRGPISVKEVIRQTHPIHRTLEIKIRGPLGFVEKFDGNAQIMIH